MPINIKSPSGDVAVQIHKQQMPMFNAQGKIIICYFDVIVQEIVHWNKLLGMTKKIINFEQIACAAALYCVAGALNKKVGENGYNQNAVIQDLINAMDGSIKDKKGLAKVFYNHWSDLAKDEDFISDIIAGRVKILSTAAGKGGGLLPLKPIVNFPDFIEGLIKAYIQSLSTGDNHVETWGILQATVLLLSNLQGKVFETEPQKKLAILDKKIEACKAAEKNIAAKQRLQNLQNRLRIEQSEEFQALYKFVDHQIALACEKFNKTEVQQALVDLLNCDKHQANAETVESAFHWTRNEAIAEQLNDLAQCLSTGMYPDLMVLNESNSNTQWLLENNFLIDALKLAINRVAYYQSINLTLPNNKNNSDNIQKISNDDENLYHNAMHIYYDENVTCEKFIDFVDAQVKAYFIAADVPYIFSMAMLNSLDIFSYIPVRCHFLEPSSGSAAVPLSSGFEAYQFFLQIEFKEMIEWKETFEYAIEKEYGIELKAQKFKVVAQKNFMIFAFNLKMMVETVWPRLSSHIHAFYQDIRMRHLLNQKPSSLIVEKLFGEVINEIGEPFQLKFQSGFFQMGLLQNYVGNLELSATKFMDPPDKDRLTRCFEVDFYLGVPVAVAEELVDKINQRWEYAADLLQKDLRLNDVEKGNVSLQRVAINKKILVDNIVPEVKNLLDKLAVNDPDLIEEYQARLDEKNITNRVLHRRALVLADKYKDLSRVLSQALIELADVLARNAILIELKRDLADELMVKIFNVNRAISFYEGNTATSAERHIFKLTDKRKIKTILAHIKPAIENSQLAINDNNNSNSEQQTEKEVSNDYLNLLLEMHRDEQLLTSVNFEKLLTAFMQPYGVTNVAYVFGACLLSYYGINKTPSHSVFLQDKNVPGFLTLKINFSVSGDPDQSADILPKKLPGALQLQKKFRCTNDKGYDICLMELNLKVVFKDIWPGLAEYIKNNVLLNKRALKYIGKYAGELQTLLHKHFSFEFADVLCKPFKLEKSSMFFEKLLYKHFNVDGEILSASFDERSDMTVASRLDIVFTLGTLFTTAQELVKNINEQYPDAACIIAANVPSKKENVLPEQKIAINRALLSNTLLPIIKEEIVRLVKENDVFIEKHQIGSYDVIPTSRVIATDAKHFADKYSSIPSLATALTNFSLLFDPERSKKITQVQSKRSGELLTLSDEVAKAIACHEANIKTPQERTFFAQTDKTLIKGMLKLANDTDYSDSEDESDSDSDDDKMEDDKHYSPSQ